MKQIESTLTNMVLVLVAVAVVTGGLLAWVNHITAKPIAQQSALTLTNGIKSVMGSDAVTVTADETVTLNLGGKATNFVVHTTSEGGAAVESTVMGFGGELKILVGFSATGEILGYTVLSQSETPGLGAKASTWFQKGEKGDIIGMNPAQKPLSVTKDGGDVDAITASTITSRAFLKAINQAYTAYQQGKKAKASN